MFEGRGGSSGRKIGDRMLRLPMEYGIGFCPTYTNAWTGIQFHLDVLEVSSTKAEGSDMKSLLNKWKSALELTIPYIHQVPGWLADVWLDPVKKEKSPCLVLKLRLIRSVGCSEVVCTQHQAEYVAFFGPGGSSMKAESFVLMVQ